MKKLYTLIVVMVLLGNMTFAQVTLTYKNHALMADKINEMKITEYVAPGYGGENQIWDFSSLKAVRDFAGPLTATYTSENNALFPETNVELNEFGNRFYFKLNEESIEQYGLVSSNGNLVISYDQPFVKMKYPFTYGDYFSGNYSGKHQYKDNAATDITGTYSVEADGYGKLILPGDKMVDNTLRVKTVRKYSRNFSNTPGEIEVTTYRWYAQNIRFPLLVLTSIKSTTNGKSHVSHQAAYRENLVATTEVTQELLAKNLEVYPNPFEDQFYMKYRIDNTSDVLIELYDNAGKKVKVLVDQRLGAGHYNYTFTNEDKTLSQGTYYLKYQVDGKSTVKTLIQTK